MPSCTRCNVTYNPLTKQIVMPSAFASLPIIGPSNSTVNLAYAANAWSLGYSTLMFTGGPVDSYILAMRFADAPANGQIPAFDTGLGRLRWVNPATGGDNLVIGTTTVTGAGADFLLFNNGGLLGAKNFTGTGNVVLSGGNPVITLGNGTGLPISTGLTGAGAGVITWLVTPSFANLNAALTGDDAAGLAADNAFTGQNSITRSSGVALSVQVDGLTASGIVSATNSPGLSSLQCAQNGVSAIFVTDSNVSFGVDLSLSQGSLIINGDGDPEGVVMAAKGSLFLRANGGSGFMAYLKISGSGDTGWQPLPGLTHDNQWEGGNTFTRSSGNIMALIGSGTASGLFINSAASQNALYLQGDSDDLFRVTDSLILCHRPISLLSSAAPTTSTAGHVAFDTNAWAANRGAIQVNDGTAATFVVATLASDVPTNGQVPTWNTGGTVTWENPFGLGVTPVADGTYTVGLGGSQDGTITVSGGVITAIQEALP